MRTCYRFDRSYWLRGRHADGCDDTDCAGCVPCTNHCGCRPACPEHLDDSHPLTSPACVGRTRTDLAVIVDTAALMLDEAIERGVDSEAAVLAGPSADPEAWSWHKVSAMVGRIDHASLHEEDDPTHPDFVLGTWEFMLRTAYEQPTTEPATASSSAAYLAGLLTRLAQDPEQDWSTFARELRACRTRLENVLHDSRKPETGAPCPMCAADPDMHRAPALVLQHGADPTGTGDRWTCPACKSRWTVAEYRLRVGTDYLMHADRLTASELHRAYRINPATLRKWAERGTVAKRGRNGHGQQLYDVAQARAARDGAGVAS